MIALLVGMAALAQTPAASLPAFDVTSVRPFKPTGPWHRLPRYDPQRFYAEGMSAFELIEEAYGLAANQIAGSPVWARGDWFTVAGTSSTPATPDQMRLMLRRLLQDRFALQVDDTTTVQPVYALVLAGKELKVPPLKPGESCSDANDARVRREAGRLRYSTIGSCDIPAWVHFLNTANRVGELDLPTVDRTGLTGSYPLALWREMDDVQPIPGTRGFTVGHAETIQEALAQELGLKLVKSTAPFRTLKITQIQPPKPD